LRGLFDEPSRTRMYVRSTDDGDELGRLRFCTDRGGFVKMTHERLFLTSCNWFEYQRRLLSCLLRSCACPPWYRSFPSHVVFPSQVISPLPLIFCFLCLTELLIHSRTHHVYAFFIFRPVVLRVCISLHRLAPNFTCTFTAHPAVSFTCHIAPAAPSFTFTFAARRVRYALSCINKLVSSAVTLSYLFLQTTTVNMRLQRSRSFGTLWRHGVSISLAECRGDWK
jgi:hypothetical protein